MARRQSGLVYPSGVSGGGGGGGISLAPTSPLAGWSTFDNSGGSVLSGVAAQFASAPERIEITIQNDAVASQGPQNGVGVYGPLSEFTAMAEHLINGNAVLTDFLTILRRPIAAFADVEAFIYFYDDGGDLGSAGGAAAPTGNMKGAGSGLVYNAGEWEAISYACAGGGTVARDESTLNRTSQHTDGVRGMYENARTSSRLTHNATGVTADTFFRGTDDTGTNGPTDNAHDIVRGFNSVAIGAGWSTGAGGSGPLVVPVFGAVLALQLGYRSN
jgi:hypothetical protein